MCVFTIVVFLNIVHRPLKDNAQKSIIVLIYRRYELLNPILDLVHSGPLH
jgi:hypothetical protein